MNFAIEFHLPPFLCRFLTSSCQICSKRLAGFLPKRLCYCAFLIVQYMITLQFCSFRPSFKSGLLAVVATQLLAMVKSLLDGPIGTDSPRISKALLAFSYSAIVLNSSAAITSLIITDKIGELPLRASRWKRSSPKAGWMNGSEDYLLRRYGIGASWTWALGHCELTSSLSYPILSLITFWHVGFISMQGGIWSILIEIMMYIWLQEAMEVKTIMVCVGVFAILPFLFFLPVSCLFRSK